MSANRIFLVCSHCREFAESLLIAERAPGQPIFSPANLKRADRWFERHATCGKPDDFQIAFNYPQNHDVVETPQPKEAALGVALALVNGSKQ